MCRIVMGLVCMVVGFGRCLMCCGGWSVCKGVYVVQCMHVSAVCIV